MDKSLPTTIMYFINGWCVMPEKIGAVKSVKGMGGKFATSRMACVYLVDEENNFIIDKETAPMVWQIYQLHLVRNIPIEEYSRLMVDPDYKLPMFGTFEALDEILASILKAFDAFMKVMVRS